MSRGSYVRMPWGKWKGKLLDEVPASYLAWVLEEADSPSPWLVHAVQEELAERFDRPAPYPPPPSACGRCEKVRALWPGLYSRLALLAHPDRGGSTGAMQLVNEANDLFRR
jgi:Putative quorum-sensing-regulated virulence factor